MDELLSFLRNSVALKLFVVGFLILLLLVPSAMIGGLVREREGRRNEAVAEIQGSWANRQLIRGPVIAVPIRFTDTDAKGKTIHRLQTAYLLPEHLDVDAKVETEKRYRGIYETAVYTASIDVKGGFGKLELDRLRSYGGEPVWDLTTVAIGISDLRGVKSDVSLRWGEKALELGPGTGPAAGLLDSGLSARIPAGPLGLGAPPLPYAFHLELRGSQGLYFAPVGKRTAARTRSSWPSPSFKGAFLPDSRKVSESGFEADWSVLDINRKFPQLWLGDQQDLDGSQFGVDLLVPVDHYRSDERATKYAVLFIFFTFLTFFFIEFFQARRLHPIQYLLVGSGIVLFYLLLLSLSEHLTFGRAYAAASLSIVAVVTGYAHGVFARPRTTAVVAGFLGVLYGCLYALLQLEDYALLLGSLSLLAALSAVMYLTRKFDWYALEQSPPAP